MRVTLQPPRRATSPANKSPDSPRLHSRVVGDRPTAEVIRDGSGELQAVGAVRLWTLGSVGMPARRLLYLLCLILGWQWLRGTLTYLSLVVAVGTLVSFIGLCCLMITLAHERMFDLRNANHVPKASLRWRHLWATALQATLGPTTLQYSCEVLSILSDESKRFLFVVAIPTRFLLHFTSTTGLQIVATGLQPSRTILLCVAIFSSFETFSMIFGGPTELHEATPSLGSISEALLNFPRSVFAMAGPTTSTERFLVGSEIDSDSAGWLSVLPWGALLDPSAAIELRLRQSTTPWAAFLEPQATMVHRPPSYLLPALGTALRSVFLGVILGGLSLRSMWARAAAKTFLLLVAWPHILAFGGLYLTSLAPEPWLSDTSSPSFFAYLFFNVFAVATLERLCLREYRQIAVLCSRNLPDRLQTFRALLEPPFDLSALYSALSALTLSLRAPAREVDGPKGREHGGSLWSIDDHVAAIARGKETQGVDSVFRGHPTEGTSHRRPKPVILSAPSNNSFVALGCDTEILYRNAAILGRAKRLRSHASPMSRLWRLLTLSFSALVVLAVHLPAIVVFSVAESVISSSSLATINAVDDWAEVTGTPSTGGSRLWDYFSRAWFARGLRAWMPSQERLVLLRAEHLALSFASMTSRQAEIRASLVTSWDLAGTLLAIRCGLSLEGIGEGKSSRSLASRVFYDEVNGPVRRAMLALSSGALADGGSNLLPCDRCVGDSEEVFPAEMGPADNRLISPLLAAVLLEGTEERGAVAGLVKSVRRVVEEAGCLFILLRTLALLEEHPLSEATGEEGLMKSDPSKPGRLTNFQREDKCIELSSDLIREIDVISNSYGSSLFDDFFMSVDWSGRSLAGYDSLFVNARERGVLVEAVGDIAAAMGLGAIMGLGVLLSICLSAASLGDGEPVTSLNVHPFAAVVSREQIPTVTLDLAQLIIGELEALSSDTDGCRAARRSKSGMIIRLSCSLKERVEECLEPWR